MKPIIVALVSLMSFGALAAGDKQDFTITDYGNYSCQVEMITRDGRFLESFEARDCYTAMNYCNYELDQRHREGRNPYARCVIVNDRGGDHRQPRPRPPYGPGPRPPYDPRPYPPPQPPPYYPPPREESWTCIANDRGYEEHAGGHAGYGRSQYEATDNAMYVCRATHGECYISECRASRF